MGGQGGGIQGRVGYGVFSGKIGVLVEKSGFYGKWGFRGFLGKKSGKSREEPGS